MVVPIIAILCMSHVIVSAETVRCWIDSTFNLSNKQA